METQPNDENAPVARLIEAFERRARARRIESYGVLALMLILLASSAWVFINARDIANKDTSRDSQSIMFGLQARKSDLASRAADISAHFAKQLAEVGELRRVDGTEPPAKFHIELADKMLKLRGEPDVVNELLNDFQRTGYVFIDYEVRLKGNTLPSARLRIYQDKLKQVKKNTAWTTVDLASDITTLAPLAQEASIADAAIAQVLADERNRQVQDLLGKAPDRVNSNLSLPFLFQLNITRFGTISFVAIGLGILSPLYRFSGRLAAFYQGRADALRLHQVAYWDTDILRMMDNLSPQFDFGKASEPPDSISALISGLVKPQKE